ncbi:MAG: Fur family transcriptional regulator, ferric uptake regulator [Nocardioidaceae bacterium]|jgi:Fur family ferric uptake transcriptional regulator|nr:Fur family transcriptional regulator, ferric uptake regulator [Nocardioidaceae bacterium]
MFETYTRFVGTGEWQQLLRDRGYRLTPQRELVLAAVEELGHATPDEVLDRVHEHSEAVNISTVYRTLELLEELGLVKHAHISDRAPTYHSNATPDHVHLVCRSCGTVLEADPSDFDSVMVVLERHHGFEPDLGHLTVFGRCAACRESDVD